MITQYDYMEFTRSTAVYPKERELEYLALGLTGEAGEVANKVKKVIRDESGEASFDTRMKIIDEVSDCLWYLTRLCDCLGTDVASVMEYNVAKLTARKNAGTIKGSGDNR